MKSLYNNGEKEGTDDGFCHGAGLESFDGLPEGAALGSFDGLPEGTVLGNEEGADELDGETLGSFDRLPDGFLETEGKVETDEKKKRRSRTPLASRTVNASLDNPSTLLSFFSKKRASLHHPPPPPNPNYSKSVLQDSTNANGQCRRVARSASLAASQAVMVAFPGKRKRSHVPLSSSSAPHGKRLEKSESGYNGRHSPSQASSASTSASTSFGVGFESSSASLQKKPDSEYNGDNDGNGKRDLCFVNGDGDSKYNGNSNRKYNDDHAVWQEALPLLAITPVVDNSDGTDLPCSSSNSGNSNSGNSNSGNSSSGNSNSGNSNSGNSSGKEQSSPDSACFRVPCDIPNDDIKFRRGANLFRFLRYPQSILGCCITPVADSSDGTNSPKGNSSSSSRGGGDDLCTVSSIPDHDDYKIGICENCCCYANGSDSDKAEALDNLSEVSNADAKKRAGLKTTGLDESFGVGVSGNSDGTDLPCNSNSSSGNSSGGTCNAALSTKNSTSDMDSTSNTLSNLPEELTVNPLTTCNAVHSTSRAEYASCHRLHESHSMSPGATVTNNSAKDHDDYKIGICENCSCYVDMILQIGSKHVICDTCNAVSIDDDDDNKNDSNGTDDRNNQIQAVTPPKGSRIRWKNQEFGFTRLPTFCTNLTNIFERACRLGKLDDTSTIVCPIHRQKLERLKVLLFDAFKAIVEASPFPKPYRLHRTINHAGVYGLSMGSHGTVIKYGMSFDCFTRADRQSPGFAFKMADCNHLRNTVIPAGIIQEIEDLGLPGIIFHKDHNERTRDFIAMQIYEGYLAAAHENNDDSTCITKTIFERLVQEPPCLDDLACEESILVQAREFLNDLGGDGAYAILSWPTMKSIVYGIADESHSELIGRRLREQPEDSFVTLYWLMAILGKDNLCGWENALSIPPEQNKLDGFLQAASGILDQDVNSCNDIEKDQLQQALATITGANGKYYVRPDPSDKTMADGFVSAFGKQKGSHYICVEHYVWKQVERHKSDWWEQEMSGVTPLCLFDDLQIFLLTTNSGRRMIVVPSFFRAFDPEPCRLEVRIKLVKSLIAFLELLQHIGVHDADYVASVRKVLVSYMMALEFGSNDGNNPDAESDLYQHDRSSARCAMPKGYMKQPLRNAITVSNAMGMNVWHHYYLELRLGRVKFRNLLLHMGLLHEQELWPSDPNWTCPGVPSSANIPAEVCGYSNGDEEDDEPSACMVGRVVGKDAHVFYGRFVCFKCYPKLQRRELDQLLSREREELTPAQAERLEELLGRKCSVPGCTKNCMQGGLCSAHGAKRKKCSVLGCNNNCVQGGVCAAHGAKRKKCSIAGCNKYCVQGGLCIGHGAKKPRRKKCSIAGCNKFRVQGGLCVGHGAKKPSKKKCNTPQYAAFLRIENDLDHGKKPAIDDLRLVLEPRRMKNRKLLLRRILQDEFNLRGKCVPPIPSEGNEIEDDLNDIDGHDEHDLEFIEYCTIERLGTFVIRLLKREDSSP